MIYRFDYAHKEAARVEELKNGPHTVGLRTTLRAVQSGKALRVYVAEDADVFVRRRVQEVCAAQDVECVKVPAMKELGSACSLQVKAACAALLRD